MFNVSRYFLTTAAAIFVGLLSILLMYNNVILLKSETTTTLGNNDGFSLEDGNSYLSRNAYVTLLEYADLDRDGSLNRHERGLFAYSLCHFLDAQYLQSNVGPLFFPDAIPPNLERRYQTTEQKQLFCENDDNDMSSICQDKQEQMMIPLSLLKQHVSPTAGTILGHAIDMIGHEGSLYCAVAVMPSFFHRVLVDDNEKVRTSVSHRVFYFFVQSNFLQWVTWMDGT